MQHVRDLARWLLPAVLAGCLGTGGRAAPPGVEALQRAEELYRAGDLLEAEPLYRAAARSAPGELRRQAYDRLLTLYARLGRPDRVVQTGLDYQPLLARQGDRARLQGLALELGQSYLALGHFAEAEAALQEALGDRRAGTSLPVAQQFAAWADLARIAGHRRDRARADERWAEVERLARAALNDPRQALAPAEHSQCVRHLADAYHARGRPREAVAALRPLLARYEAARDRAGMREVLRRRATHHAAADDLEAAEADLRRALALEGAADEGPFTRADLLGELTEVLTRRGRRGEAAAALREAVDAYGEVLKGARASKPRSARAAEAFWKLERLYERAQLYRQALQLTEEQAGHWGSDTPVHGRLRGEQGSLQVLFSAYDKARGPLTEALAELEAQSPPDLRQLPPTLNALAVAEQYAGRPARAEELGQKCLALYRRHGLPDDLALAEAYNVLGTAAALNGDYVRAVDRYRAGVACCEKLGSAAGPQHSYLLLNLAVLHKSQGEPAEALQDCLKAEDVYRRFAGPDGLGLACFDAALANLYAGQGLYPEADARAARVLRLCARAGIAGGPLVVTARHCRALQRLSERDPAGAEKLWREVLAVQEKERDRLLLPRTLNYLGLTAELQGRAAEAEALFRRSADLQRQGPRAQPGTLFISLWRLAELAYRAGRQEEALRLLGEAVEVVEAARLRLYGDAKQRSAFFAQFVMAFERLVDWNVRAGRLEDACRAAARGRSRALLDQLQLAGVDPRQSLRGGEGQRLRRREADLRRRIAAVQARAQLVPRGDAARPEAVALLRELEQAQADYAETWREVLNASPLYRSLAADAGGDTLAALRQRVLRKDNLLLWYWVGRERSYLFLVGDATRPVEVIPLRVPEGVTLARAERLAGETAPPDTRGLEVRPGKPGERPARAPAAGPLTQAGARLLVGACLEHIQGPGAAKRGLRVATRPGGAVRLSDVEAAGVAFLPAEARRRIRELAPEYLLVVPDGPLHKLPLEALVLQGGKEPRYALDELPPLVYAPSAAVLAALADRPPLAAGPVSLLTVGDVAYPQTKPGAGPADGSPGGAGVLGLGGTFPPLPFSGEESRRVRRLFDPTRVTALEGAGATEKAVTSAVAGRRFLHLAAHGFVDERYGNLFGALAVALPPGREAPGDDGFLELHEVYQLPLKDCELAVLSACETNVGPQRPLEAGVTLAGGFLAAGARRVVASHWSVEDRSTAELMAAFFEQVTAARGDGRVSFARALQKARQQVRSRPEWSAPFYWAPFVLLGPGD
jgi:CHAT domain-containing protein/tetratricopeptide (TPR) repeat protein